MNGFDPADHDNWLMRGYDDFIVTDDYEAERLMEEEENNNEEEE